MNYTKYVQTCTAHVQDMYRICTEIVNESSSNIPFEASSEAAFQSMVLLLNLINCWC